jgi:hypothetical protein
MPWRSIVDIDDLMKELGRLSKPQLQKLLQNLDHVTFSFTINNSFLKYGSHPITIPREVNEFLTIHGITRNQDLRILFPDGSMAVAYIYQGKSSCGEYYQIKIRQSSTGTGIGVSQFKQGDPIKVEMVKSQNTEQITLSMMR